MRENKRKYQKFFAKFYWVISKFNFFWGETNTERPVIVQRGKVESSDYQQLVVIRDRIANHRASAYHPRWDELWEREGENFLRGLGHFSRYRPIRIESARFGLRRCRFQPRRPDSGIATWHDAARTRGLRRPSRVAASDAGALAWEPRPCIPDSKTCMVVMELVSQHLDE